MSRPKKKPTTCEQCPNVRLVEHADNELVCPKCGIIYRVPRKVVRK